MYIKGIAFHYGAKAFKKGIRRVPAYDQDFLTEVITGLKNGESIKYLKEWADGWDSENLKELERKIN